MIKVTIEPPKERTVTIEMTDSEALKLRCYLGSFSNCKIYEQIESNVNSYYKDKFGTNDVYGFMDKFFSKLCEVVNN